MTVTKSKSITFVKKNEEFEFKISGTVYKGKTMNLLNMMIMMGAMKPTILISRAWCYGGRYTVPRKNLNAKHFMVLENFRVR